jgi:catechol 2,3-dioxygenase-like lactoylglutathione lyase family enzyme
MLALADVAVMVKDARASARWWQETLGFATYTIGDAGGHAVMVAPPGDRFVLHLCEGFAPIEPGNSGIAFVTDDLEGHVRRMVAAGVPFPEPLKTEAWGGMAKFADPDGNVFWLMGAPAAFIRGSLRKRAAGPKPKRAAPKRRATSQRRRA